MFKNEKIEFKRRDAIFLFITERGIGTKVILCDLPESRGNQIAKELGSDVIFVPTDVTVSTAIATAKSNFGRLDVRVNCAATSCANLTYDIDTGIMHQLQDFNNVMNVNVIGTFNVIRLSAGLTVENEPNSDGQRGVIINTSGHSAYDGQKQKYGITTLEFDFFILLMMFPCDMQFKQEPLYLTEIISHLKHVFD